MTQLTLAQQIGARIAQERREKGTRERRDIDQKTVAKALHVSAGAVSRWEKGLSVPKDGALGRVAAYFGVTPAWLRYGTEPREAPRPVGVFTELAQPDKPATKKRKRG